ncbi:rab effector MyRIP [Scomber scombrus]|uniref:Rab effector MyRIP n=1 Tax=Scomber scombrus TaxID=13677 RepID=A0AAV1NF33_SCOSC
MGRKLDLSGLSDREAEHVLQVVQRDMKLRKKEDERLSELKQELDEEGSRCLLLSRQSCFNRRCCIRCCAPFTFLLNPKRQCRDCLYNVCKACRVYNKQDKAWLCSVCQKSRLLKTQSLEWFYTNVKTRFKRFGSAKVLKTLYRKHLVEHSALAELTEGSAYEESIGNEGSVCGSDSTLYRQSQEHSMAETLTVALRVAEEAIDEAISAAEFDTSSQEKKDEAHYLRKHRGELVEELAKTIVQKIISRRKTVSDIKAEYEHDWLFEHNMDLLHQPSADDQASSSFKNQPGLWRSQSAFSMLDNDSPGLVQETHQALKKEGGGSALSTWKSVDRLDNSMLKSPDGNWIALQSAQLSRPSLLTRRKSLVYSALERESGVVSAYEGMGFDNETKSELDSSWGAVLHEIHKKMTDSNFNLPDTEDRISPHVMDRRSSRDSLVSDSEGNWKLNKPVLGLLKRKLPVEIRRPSSSPRTSIIDMNFNVERAGEERSATAEPTVRKVRRSRKKKKTEKELTASSPVLDYSKKDNQSQHTSDAVTPDTLTSGGTTPEPWNPEKSDGEREDDMEEDYKQQKEEKLTYKLCLLEKQVRASQFSSTEDELDRVGITDEEKRTGEEEELAMKVSRLANQVNVTQFSSTDDELDRKGEEGEEKIDGVTFWKLQAQKAVQAAKVRDLASLVSASQFSSTEDELDRFGENEGETEQEVNEGGIESSIEIENLWEGAVGKSHKRRESIGDLDVKMFDLREEIEERMNERSEEKVEKETMKKFEDFQPEKTKIEGPKERDCMEKRVTEETEEDEGMLGKVEVFKETKERQETQLKTGLGAERREERTEEIIAFYETRVGPENQPEAKLSDKKEGEERWEEEKIKEIKQSEEKWETASNSEEEDAEFDRIISSMLMITLEDMQVGALKDNGENGGMNRELETDEGAKVDLKADKAGGAKERPGENITEQTEGDISTKQESVDATGGNKSELQEKHTDPQEKRLADKKPTDMTSKEINGAQRTCKRMEVDDENTKGEMTKEWQMMERQGDAAVCESKDTNERLEKTKEKHADDTEQSSTSSLQEGLLSPEEIQNGSDVELYKTIEFISTLLEQRYSAVSLRSITTEVLKVLNATEELLQGVEGGEGPRLSTTSLPPNTDPKKLDQQFSRLEEHVYVAAGTVYSLEAELSDLEECARGICSATSDMELSFLEEQVASAAAKVQQSDLQICDISARIAALKSAGLNVDPQSSHPKNRTIPVMPVTLDSSRQLRRRLPAPPVKEDKEP